MQLLLLQMFLDTPPQDMNINMVVLVFFFAFHPPVSLGHTRFHGKIVSSHKYFPLILNYLHQHNDIKCTQLN